MDIPWLDINDSNSVFLYNHNPLNSSKILSPDKRAVRLVGFENSKVGSFRLIIFSILKRRVLALFS